MVTDLYTKAVLTIIAVALALSALNPWLAPTRAEASKHENVVVAIFGTLSQIANGSCKNPKICHPK